MRERLNVVLLAARLLLRDLAGGRLSVMLLASVVAVACTVSVNLLVARVGSVLVAESSALLAADLAIASNERPPARYAEQAAALGLSTARVASMRSVVSRGDALQLVRLRAVGDGYPLRGAVRTGERLFGPSVAVRHGPPPGEAWADAKLTQLLGLETGDTITVGRKELRVSRVLVLEPDRGGDLFSIAPRVMMNLDDLEQTGLVVEGSRVAWRTLVAGHAANVARYRATLDPRPGDRIRDPREARPEVSTAFTQAERFLALAAFAGVMLATIGIALAAASYGQHHEATTAIVRTLGLTRREIVTLFVVELALLAALAALAGNAVAALTHTLLIERFLPAAALEGTAMPLLPFVHGAGLALVALLGFACPPLARLARLPVTAILSRDRDRPRALPLTALVPMLAATLLIAPWYAGEPRLVAVALGGMLASAALLAGAAYALVALMGRLRARTSMSWRFGLANIARRARLSVLQSTAVGLGIAVLLLLGLVRGDLVEQWAERVPPDAPNHFLINVQRDERNAMLAFLQAQGLDVTAFYPMVRGRLTRIGEREIRPEDYADPRARRLADREFNLSWAETLKADNRLVAGRWWAADGQQGEMSVEQGIAETLGIELGDVLTFRVAGSPVTGTVTNLRAVEWDNFQVNFFVVTTPDVLVDEPATFITAFRLPEGRDQVMAELVSRYPSVTVIDVDALMRQVRALMARVSSALMWVFGFSLAAGMLVLAAAVQSGQRERVLDSVLLRTLGASTRFVRATTFVEFALLGALSGLLASVGAAGTGWLLANYVLDMPYAPGAAVPLAGLGAGVAGVTLVGLVSLGRSLRAPVTEGIRAAQ